MEQSIKSPLIIRILAILMLMLRIFTVNGQQGSQGNTTIFGGAEMRSDLLIYPDPAKEFVYTQSGNPELIKGVRMIGQTGKEVQSSFPLVNNMMNIKNAASGAYFVQVFYKDGSVDSHKLSIIK